MDVLLQALMVIVGIISVVCWIMVLIKIFKDNVGLGILGVVCGLFAFIYGWVKVKEYAVKKIMIVWSIVFVVSLVLNALGAGAAFTQIMQQATEATSQ
ncbi:MAG: hypothetical protein HQ559_13895 [Lentisphaerae bacterium]|nr:hypothetical protein [Lentisphaerota bacterium]